MVFCPKILPKIIASHFLYNSLAALVRRIQAQKCFWINPKRFHYPEFYTNLLFDYCHNTTMERATGVALLNVTYLPRCSFLPTAAAE